MIKARVYQFLLILLSAFGVFFGAALSLSHLRTGDVCPLIGPVPACLIVFSGYSLILISAIFVNGKTISLFYLGWSPVLTLALVGVTLELTQGQICPAGVGNVPQCFYSLAMAVLCFALFYAANSTNKI